MRDESQSERRRGLLAIYAPIRIVGCVQKEWDFRGAATGAFCGFAAPVGEDGAGGKHGYSGEKRPQSMLLMERYKQRTIYKFRYRKARVRKKSDDYEEQKSSCSIKNCVTCGMFVPFDSSKLEI